MKKQNNQPTIKKSFFQATKSFISITPMILAVVGLVALFQTYVTPTMLSNLFGFSPFTDTFVGTFIGAISSGNGALSFVVADGLEEQGVSLYAISAFILAWITLSFVQIPAEVSVFGVTFTTYRNILAIFSTILISYLTVITIMALK